MNYCKPCHCDEFEAESLRLEVVITCVGFADVLAATLPYNHPHFDHIIVVTSHEDKETHAVCHKHGVTCVQTDLFKYKGRKFNKGAAINAGFDYFKFHGFRVHMDCDVVPPDNFRRILFNHCHLDKSVIYGADRIDVIGIDALRELRDPHKRNPQHSHGMLVDAPHGSIGARYVDPLRGYCPIGFFQLWHAKAQKAYPESLGTAKHDDVMFAALWPASHRHHLPQIICHHLSPEKTKWGQHWEGRRSGARIGKPK